MWEHSNINVLVVFLNGIIWLTGSDNISNIYDVIKLQMLVGWEPSKYLEEIYR